MPLCLLPDRALLRLSGPDARTLLQGLVTQDLDQLSADQPLYAGLLSPQGKTLFQLFLFADGQDVLADVAAADRPLLQQQLLRFRLRKKVDILLADELAMFQQWGEPATHPADPRYPLAGSRFPAQPSQPPTVPLAEWHQHRLPLGLPEADEIGHDDLLWLETNARELNGVSFTKGCYTGQENTARMHHRNRIRKRLLPLRLSGPAEPNASVMADGTTEAGRLRGARHGDLQMVLLRVEYLDRPLSVAGATATALMPPWLGAADLL